LETTILGMIRGKRFSEGHPLMQTKRSVGDFYVDVVSENLKIFVLD
jgi:hypothetical protein